ncbi:MAG: hypothetical protein KA508_03940 [Gammaproteobacteria bacterium]|nr:hypothetical protein [Gammaproteobacteria bacterium]
MANQDFRKLEKLQQKIELWQKEQALAEQAVAQDLVTVLKALGAFQWDFELVVGVLVQAFEKGLASESKEALSQAGKTFLKKNRSSLDRTRVLASKSSD